ncbi:ATP phosphoribosyltransferase [Microvirga sp. W0021]|uniref:ATP phosphoribosyltransferase n=1 Tax=Hohaiivirga grylli TaxID=3133970 RepID=A0ABV0BGY2_9HYPH
MTKNEQDKLIIAVPSKGRLQENAMAFFSRAGLVLERSRGSRDYRGSIQGFPNVEVLFLSASEIVSQLASGAAHLGVTGEDLVREQIADADEHVESITPLGFGHANVVVAVPQAWIDVRSMADLDEVASDLRTRHGSKMRVATKYINLTRRFFADKGVSDYRIVESLGATEGAPASGSAEIIVDITSTGATLVANGLKVLDDGVMLRSEANLFASCKAQWGQGARTAIRQVLARISAAEEARTNREISMVFEASRKQEVIKILGQFRFIQIFGEQTNGLTLHCRNADIFQIVEALQNAGCDDITVRSFDYIFRSENPLLSRLEKRIGQ